MDDGGLNPASVAAILTILPIVFLVLLLPTIFFLLTLQRALARCEPSIRTMAPGQVWLMLVPFLNLVWTFLVVNALAESLGREFARRGIPADREPGKGIGMAYAVLTLLTAVPLLGFLTCLPALVCWILYWIKVGEFSERLSRPQPSPAAA